ncbi:osteopetrosis-associated transmembrane protein 1 [Echeneis naucrates]|uniref:Osteoclastogenesis associated transmembrane protein 1 n=1 Tax=Echeneis naucrates TaxID=173247 RepID=A0A665X065_ECHNA|nr:osteopetrosis-associated transmembrane protein 1 [Echeneis naucrates]XP_029352553.1 osteopetrosis-associated transmembrane protein 1 [Echeneis naucrates]XP_029352554.1 osteopetrosis-associated transmembrane protein 1 [Echeneis naucrates]
MSPRKDGSFLVLLTLNVFSLGSGDVGAADSALSPVGVDSPSSLPESPELTEYCSELLHTFSQRYEAYVGCLIPAARPVQVCRNCSSGYGDLVKVYANISSDQTGPSNVSCKDSLLGSDRLMVVSALYSNVEGLWKSSKCEKCITKELQGPTNSTLYFMSTVSQTLSCFVKYQQGNHTELCKNCKSTYRGLNELYSGMENNDTLCIDLEDMMNMTRILWSKDFGCSLPREEMVPVIAVSSFMLFLPIIFYLSSFLHSEQKKRKLIHPKRAKSYASLMNIQDKMS